MTVREATAAELSRVSELVRAYMDELWQRPFPPGRIGPEELEGKPGFGFQKPPLYLEEAG